MLKIQTDRVIIDGHEPTKEQCETMTLLANALAESNNFKTVEYRDGYAEFEKVGKADELKFVPQLPIKIYSYDGSEIIADLLINVSTQIEVKTDGLYEVESGALLASIPNLAGLATEPNGNIVYNIGDIFVINSNLNLYAKQSSGATKVSVDITTLPGWSSLSDGSHNITIVAKATGYRDSEPSAAVSVEKAPAVVMPVKGDIITLDSKQYRVLKTEGTIAEVLCMYDANSSIKFDSASSGFNNTYAGKSLDTYCNNTFYSGLSAAMKSAIVDKTFTQDSWAYHDSVPTESHYTGKYGSYTYCLTLGNAAFGDSITRHCYVLSIQEVLDYLNATTSMGISDTTLINTNIWKMFWNQSTSPGSTNPWLRSADANTSDRAFYVDGSYGYLDNIRVAFAYEVRPAFQIDLSKIAWSK